MCQLREPRQLFGDLDARYRGIDRTIGSADFDGRIRLQIERIVLGRSAIEKDKDAVASLGGRIGKGLGSQLVGQCQAAQREMPEPQQFAPVCIAPADDQISAQ